MKILYKLLLGYLSVALLVCFLGYSAIYTGQKILQNTIGENSARLTDRILQIIDKEIYCKIENFQEYSMCSSLRETILKSNQDFEKLENIQDYIDEKDKEWISAPKDEISPFMQELMSNELAAELKEKVKYYNEKYGYSVYPEVFATNKYGANVVQTGKTTDYRQDDEEWWQGAKKDGIYIGDIQYDSCSEIYSLIAGIRVDGDNGDFIGVLKVILSSEEIDRVIKERKQMSEYKTIDIELINKNGEIIHAPEERFEFLKDVSKWFLIIIDHGKDLGYFMSEGDSKGEGKELISYAHSKGYRDYKGLGWILIAEYETKEIFAPIISLRDGILMILLGVVTLVALPGVFIFRSISAPITKLKIAIEEIGKGNLNAEIAVKSSDEVGHLANSFKKMLTDLKKTTTSIANLNKEIATRKEAEEKLKKAYEDIKETQAQLIQSEKLAALGQIATGAAHEINNPLTAIFGEAQILLRDEDKDRDTKNAAKVIAEQSKRIKTITERLLVFSRKVEIKMEPLNINDVLEASLFLLTYSLKTDYRNYKIDIIKKLDSNLPQGHGDRNQLQEVFLNIMMNAIQAIEREGKITIRTRSEEVTEDEAGKSDVFKQGQRIVVIEFEDTGKGMDGGTLKRIFDPFFTTKEKSTGLGLSICYGIVGSHNGAIEAQSELGKGSTFFVKLPVMEVKK